MFPSFWPVENPSFKLMKVLKLHGERALFGSSFPSDEIVGSTCPGSAPLRI